MRRPAPVPCLSGRRRLAPPSALSSEGRPGLATPVPAASTARLPEQYSETSGYNAGCPWPATPHGPPRVAVRKLPNCTDGVPSNAASAPGAAEPSNRARGALAQGPPQRTPTRVRCAAIELRRPAPRLGPSPWRPKGPPVGSSQEVSAPSPAAPRPPLEGAGPLGAPAGGRGRATPVRVPSPRHRPTRAPPPCDAGAAPPSRPVPRAALRDIAPRPPSGTAQSRTGAAGSRSMTSRARRAPPAAAAREQRRGAVAVDPPDASPKPGRMQWS